MENITVVIHSYNSAEDIKECILSAKLLTNNIIVIDMESTDQTVSIAKNMKIPVYSFPFSRYVEPAREFGILKTKTDWVFILDTDERITPEVVQEVREKIITFSFSFYKISRRNIFAYLPDRKGKWLKYGGWWPDFQIRLINKNYLKTWPKEIHSTPIIEGSCGFFSSPITHYFHGDFEKMVQKTIDFEDIESDLLFKADRKVSTLTFFRKFFGEFYRRFLRHLGFLDGSIGIIEAIYQSFSKTITYLYLYEKKKSRSLHTLS